MIYAVTDAAPITIPSGGATLHARGSIPNASTALSAIVTVPSWTTAGGGTVFPKAVLVAMESGVTDVVRVRMDNTAATTTLGLLVPTEPSFLLIPFPEGIRAGTQIRFISTVNGTKCQFYFQV